MAEDTEVNPHYPRFMFHESLDEGKWKGGRLFKTAEELDAAMKEDDRWVDTPAKFDPNYKAPARKLGPGEELAEGEVEAPPEGEQYPRWIFPSQKDEKGDPMPPVLVQTAEAHATYDPDLWHESPDPKTWGKIKRPVAARQLGDSLPATTSQAVAGSAAVPAAQPSQADVDAAADERARQVAEDAKVAERVHNATVDEIAVEIDKCNDPEALKRLRMIEAINPDGPRVGILKPIKAKLDSLAADKA